MQFGSLTRAALLAVFLFSPASFAAKPTEAELAQRREDAQQRYEKGVAAYQEGRHKDAIDLFLEADALAPSSALSFNIARAYEKIKDSSNALKWYRDYLRREPEAEDKDKVVELIKGYEGVLQQKGVQQVSVLSEPETATVRIDGRPVGVTPWTGEIPPGAHTVSLSLSGYSDSEQQVTLAADKALDVMVRLMPASEAPAAPPPAAPATPPPQGAQASAAPKDSAAPAESEGVGVLTYVALGAGVATLGGAAAFEFMRRSSEEDAKNAVTQIEFVEARDEAEQQQKMARILAGAGAALTVAGGVLLGLDLSKSSSTSGRGGSQRPGLVASALCAKTHCYASVRGSF